MNKQTLLELLGKTHLKNKCLREIVDELKEKDKLSERVMENLERKINFLRRINTMPKRSQILWTAFDYIGQEIQYLQGTKTAGERFAAYYDYYGKKDEFVLKEIQSSSPTKEEREFAEILTRPFIENMIENYPKTSVYDPSKSPEEFPEPFRKKLPGTFVAPFPLAPSDEAIIGAWVFYKRGEQPFLQGELLTISSIQGDVARAISRQYFNQ
jgi:hypothetical protein